MGRREYPRWSGLAKGYKGQPKDCECCHRRATQIVGVDFGYMSDDRETYLVCDKHAAMAQNSLRRFLAHANTADKWRQERAKEGGEHG